MPRHRRKVGKGFKDFMGKAGNFLKKTQLLSRVGSSLMPLVPGQYRPIAQMGLDYAKSKGYGRRRIYRRGGALRPAGMRRGGGCCGGALVPAGGARMSRKLHVPALPKRLPMRY